VERLMTVVIVIIVKSCSAALVGAWHGLDAKADA
jgi:hypothetical protein